MTDALATLLSFSLYKELNERCFFFFLLFLSEPFWMFFCQVAYQMQSLHRSSFLTIQTGWLVELVRARFQSIFLFFLCIHLKGFSITIDLKWKFFFFQIFIILLTDSINLYLCWIFVWVRVYKNETSRVNIYSSSSAVYTQHIEGVVSWERANGKS